MELLKNNAPTIGITLLLASLTAIQPLSTDMYLPSFLSIQSAFNTDIAKVQFTLTIFMFGFALGQIFYGPFADKYGRRPVLIVGLLIYLAGAGVCIMATNIEMLIAGRLLQALGGCGPMVIGRTIVRDILTGAAAGRLLALIGFIMGFMPMIGPIIGGVLQAQFGWQSSFYVFLFYGIMLISFIIFLLPETVPKKTNIKLTPIVFIKIYNGLLSSSRFRYFSARISWTYAGIFTFISGSSYYFQTHFELSAQQFSYAFALTVFGYMSGTLLGARYVGKIGVYKLIMLGACLQIVGGVSMFISHISGVFHVAQIIIPMIIFLIGAGLIMPQSLAGVMHDFPNKAGAASSLAGVIQISTAAIIGTFVGLFIEDYIIIMPLTLAVVCIVNFVPCFVNRHNHL